MINALKHTKDEVKQMKKYCEDCKWNSYNMEVKSLKSMNFIKRFFIKIFCFLEIEKAFPKCCHPEVFFKKNDLVFKKNEKEKMFCETARTETTPNWKTCGEEGKYFEENE